MSTAIDRINLGTMRTAHVVAHYARHDRLLPHERVALDHVSAEVRGRRILDIGVGGGRTVAALRAISSDYTGIDYSAEMVHACRKRYPGVRFELADARDMQAVATASVGLAVFSCNGISMVGHEDRLCILREVHRVLEPDGLFVFTTYNRNSPEANAGYRLPEFVPSRNPLRLAVRSARWLRDVAIGLRQRRRHVRHEEHTSRYALLNDMCHNYGVMLYYITLEHQRQQLVDAGFAPDALAIDCNGQQICADSTLDSMALIARKS